MEGNCIYCGAPLEVDATRCAYCDSLIPGAYEREQAKAEAAAAKAAKEEAEAQAKAETVKNAVETVGKVVGASLLSGMFRRSGRNRYTSPAPPPPRGGMGGPGGRGPGGPGGPGGRGPGGHGGMGGPGGRR